MPPRNKNSKALKAKAKPPPPSRNVHNELETQEEALGQALSTGASFQGRKSQVNKQADDAFPDNQYRTKRFPVHPTVSMLRKKGKAARKGAITPTPSSHASPTPSSDLGFYDTTDAESYRSDDSTAETDDGTPSAKARNRSLRGVGGSLEQQMTEKAGRYLEAWCCYTAPWAQGTDLSAAINFFWKRCQESFREDVELNKPMKKLVRVFVYPYGSSNG